MKVKNIIFSGAMASILMVGGAYADPITASTGDNRLATASYVINGVRTAEVYADNAVSAEAAIARAAEQANADNIAELDSTVVEHTTSISTLMGAATVEGSVAKAEKDAKDYADTLDAAMDGRVDALEATVGGAESGLVKDVADLKTAVGDSGALATAISAEENRAKGVEGDKSTLTTDDKTNLVAAINEVDTNADAAQSAADAAQTDVNNLKTNVGTVSAAAMGTSATTVVTAIKELSDKSVKAGNGVTVGTDGTVAAKAGNGITVDENGISLGYTLTGDAFPTSAS